METMGAEALLIAFEKTAVAIRDAVLPITGPDRRARTDRPGQYAIDIVADRAALDILSRLPVTVVSEESGITGPTDGAITVVIDPIDGSSNAARQIPYWATSLCALDRDGPLAALVVNHATGSTFRAQRGGGATHDGVALVPSAATRVEDAVVAISNLPGRLLPWKQFPPALGSCALALCDVAAGAFDGYFDAGSVHAPWDYLGGLLVCTEAGVGVIDTEDRPLGIADPSVRRRLVAAGTPQLLRILRHGRRVTQLDLAHLVQVAERAARAGGEVVLAGFGGASNNVREKAAGDWVSDVDTASEHAVRDALAEGAPGIAFFGEETGGERAPIGWLVDPLDGTANFLHGLPAVGVSVGLVQNGEPVVGVVHAPMLGDTYVASRGGGATCNGEALSVSRREPHQAIPATGFPFRRKDRVDAYLEVFGAAFSVVEDLRRVGAASLDLAWTAAGVFDGFFELALGPWDVAAGALLVREAGGLVTDWVGHPDEWLVTGDILAAPPAVHARLLQITQVADI